MVAAASRTPELRRGSTVSNVGVDSNHVLLNGDDLCLLVPATMLERQRRGEQLLDSGRPFAVPS